MTGTYENCKPFNNWLRGVIKKVSYVFCSVFLRPKFRPRSSFQLFSDRCAPNLGEQGSQRWLRKRIEVRQKQRISTPEINPPYTEITLLNIIYNTAKALAADRKQSKKNLLNERAVSE